MTKLHTLYGSLVALITPFNQDGSIDLETFKKLVELHLNASTQGLILGGTTGEGATLSFEELTQLLETAKQINQGKMALILGLAANATHKAVTELKKLAELQPDAVMVLSPYYNKPPQSGIFAHFAELNKVGVPLIAYNVPGRTGSNIEAATTLQMANELQNVIAVKEASGNLEQIREILKNRPANFIVYSGDDSISFELLTDGINGTISVFANEYPAEFQQMFTEFKNGNLQGAKAIQDKFVELMDANFIESNPIPVKTYMQIQGLIPECHFRLPLVNAKSESIEKLKLIYQNL